jgi:hypothetical protein
MAARKKENGSLTNSARYKAEQETDKKARARVKERLSSVGDKAKQVADNAGVAFQAVSTAANTVASGAAKASEVVGNTAQALGALTGYKGYTGHRASGELTTTGDPYGGVSVPTTDIASLIPTDLLNPQIQLKATEERLTAALSEYAAGTRAQQLLQAGYRYIEEVGKTKQSMHKAQSSIIKGVIEEVRVKSEVVNFDIANVALETNKEKLNQANEKLKQEQVKTLAAQNETAQLIEKTEALEGKRSAEIQRIRAQTNDIIQKYLKDSIHQSAV